MDEAAKIALQVKAGKKKLDSVDSSMRRKVSALSRNVPEGVLRVMAERPDQIAKYRGFEYSKPRRVHSS